MKEVISSSVSPSSLTCNKFKRFLAKWIQVCASVSNDNSHLSCSRKLFYEHEESVKSRQMASKKLSNSSDGKVSIKTFCDRSCNEIAHFFLRSERLNFSPYFSLYFFFFFFWSSIFCKSVGEKATHWYSRCSWIVLRLSIIKIKWNVKKIQSENFLVRI